MNDTINVDIILTYIKQNNLTKSQFCKICKISLKTFNGLINGKNDGRLGSILKIAKQLNCNPARLFI